MNNPEEIDRALRRLESLHKKAVAIEEEIVGVIQLLRSPDFDGRCAASWSDIGDALNLTRQGAHQRYDRHV